MARNFERFRKQRKRRELEKYKISSHKYPGGGERIDWIGLQTDQELLKNHSEIFGDDDEELKIETFFIKHGSGCFTQEEIVFIILDILSLIKDWTPRDEEKILRFISQERRARDSFRKDPPMIDASNKTVLDRKFSNLQLFREIVNIFYWYIDFSCLFKFARCDMIEEIEKHCEIMPKIIFRKQETMFLETGKVSSKGSKEDIVNFTRRIIRSGRHVDCGSKLLKSLAHALEERHEIEVLAEFMLCVNPEEGDDDSLKLVTRFLYPSNWREHKVIRVFRMFSEFEPIKKIVWIQQNDEEIKRIVQVYGVQIVIEIVIGAYDATGEKPELHYLQQLLSQSALTQLIISDDNTAGMHRLFWDLIVNEGANRNTLHVVKCLFKLKMLSPIAIDVIHQCFVEYLEQINPHFAFEEKQFNKIEVILKFLTSKFNSVKYHWIFEKFAEIFRFFCHAGKGYRQTFIHFFYHHAGGSPMMKSHADSFIREFVRQLKTFPYFFDLLVGQNTLKSMLWNPRIENSHLWTDKMKRMLHTYMRQNTEETVTVLLVRFCSGLLSKDSIREFLVAPFSDVVTFDKNFTTMKIGGRKFKCDDNNYPQRNWYGQTWDDELEYESSCRRSLFKGYSLIEINTDDPHDDVCSMCKSKLIENDADLIFRRNESSHGDFVCQRCFDDNKEELKVISCGVCLSDCAVLPVILRCKHVLCSTCLEKYEATKKCPFCRAKLSEDDVTHHGDKAVRLSEIREMIMTRL